MAKSNKNAGPYSVDSNTVKHRGVLTKTILNTPTFDSLITNLDSSYEYDVGYIPAGYEHRPDLISNLFYGSPKNWWLLMLVNSVTDPNEGFKQNDKILIPKIV